LLGDEQDEERSCEGNGPEEAEEEIVGHRDHS
jgi:hypothetical protein